ncbi:fumarylacetoacetate hydrolase-like protein [Phaeosphaeriaceae sp. PMI808]|nr:fumarylacetoacetate hydrolase-like protein [Phaeosphaeriaceae sp. PMI808]
MSSFRNYVAYQDPVTERKCVGHYDLVNRRIQRLSFSSGTPLEDIYQVIETGSVDFISSSEFIPASSVEILPPLTRRDVLCVGKNYAEHAKEFNNSGFDSSDKVDQPSHPVIFTKRFTSIIADGEEIFPHPEFTQTLDYEGEIGVIIGKPGFRISQADAMKHVWGYTIINDVTARERQRDHKQFYIGKSADTFCPMGPIAVPASDLDKVLRVQTHVNGELRQDATTDDLIFSIPYLIKTMSEGQTLIPGDVLATGTPAGVGLGRKPPVYLNPGDTVAVSVTGLGTLTNRIADLNCSNPTARKFETSTRLLQTSSVQKTLSSSLTIINNKPLYYKHIGKSTGPPIVFAHGLGTSNEYFSSLIHSSGLLESHSLHLFDLEGHGLSPTTPLSKITIETLAEDLNGVFEHANISSGAVLIAHSIGCLAAMQFLLTHPGKVSKLVLFGPPQSPLSAVEKQGMLAMANTVRLHGMHAIVDAVASASTSKSTKELDQTVLTAVRMSLLSQNAEGYAKACTALAEATELNLSSIKVETWIIVGTEDNVSTTKVWERYLHETEDLATVSVIEDVGNWHIFENLDAVKYRLREFIFGEE